MKILVFAHRLEVGGTQYNAIELAARLRDAHGFDPVLFATPGPMVDMVTEKRLRFVAAPDARFHPSRRRMSVLRRLVSEEKPDLIHAWDWWQCLEVFYGVHIPQRLPLIVTDMMMKLTRILPRSLPTTFGTPEVVDTAVKAGYKCAHLLVPPVDIDLNSPGTVDCAEFRESNDIDSRCVTIVTVSRLSRYLKGESLLRTIQAVGKISGDVPVKLLIVGAGEAREELQRWATEINDEAGRTVVALTGEARDPRAAYEAADIVVGMGGSALRGAAFGKPVVVVGENGFCDVLTPETAVKFYYHGIYGHGDGDPDNHRLTLLLRDLSVDPRARDELGCFARDFVAERFAVDKVAAQLAEYCRDAVAHRRGPDMVEALRTTWIYLRERRFLTPSRDRFVT